jgi:hypothetical protein
VTGHLVDILLLSVAAMINPTLIGAVTVMLLFQTPSG